MVLLRIVKVGVDIRWKRKESIVGHDRSCKAVRNPMLVGGGYGGDGRIEDAFVLWLRMRLA